MPRRRSWPIVPILLFLLPTALGIWTYLALEEGPIGPRAEEQARIVFIPPGTGVREIAMALERAGVIRSRWPFLALAYLQGSLRRLHAGEYEFRASISLGEILRLLESGKVVTHQVTIPEGFTAGEIGRLLSLEGLGDEGRFVAVVRDPAFAGALGLGADSLEGYLFPDTYRLAKGMTEEEVARIMVSRFRQVVGPEIQARARQMGWDLHGVVILASLIEKEAKTEAERRLVSSVFHNRLRRGMPLQSDPTAVYGRPRPNRRITRADLQVQSPYNTYLRQGLPPGPIASPGLAAVQAAVNPAQANYLYFVSKNDGTHFFSRTLEEHARAVRKYQGAREDQEAPGGAS